MSLVLLIAVAGACLAQDDKPSLKNPLAGDAKAAEAGRLAFRIYCSPCHGIHAEGGRGPDLTRGTYAAGETDADLFRVISAGVPGTEMSAYGGEGEDEKIWRFVSYIRSAARRDRAPIAGDGASGEKLFWGKGGCGQCHRVGAKGSVVGPDLSRVGRQRSLAHLRESVVAPNADVAPAFATITVVTRDGKKITGVQKGFDNFSGQLVDLSGNYYSFLKEDVASMKREFRSLMPDNYGRLFGERELNDLLAYLSGLGGEK